MPRFWKGLLKITAARLNRSVVTWVFASVILIEAIILIPSYGNRKKELLSQIQAISSAKISIVLGEGLGEIGGKDLASVFRRLVGNSVILGGQLYTDGGKEICTFGEKPHLTYAAMQETGKMDYLESHRYRYDFGYRFSTAQNDYVLILSHDAASVKMELQAFLLRITGLVLIISIFVTVGAWLALVPLVITPILRLRGDLIRAGEAVKEDRIPTFRSVAEKRENELGEVIAAFIDMFGQIQQAIEERKKAEDSLQGSLLQVESYSRALNSEMEKGKQIQRDFLPDRFPRLAEWEIAAAFIPAKQVSGDFYDVFALSENRVGLAIGDVSDKGVGAALYMALIRSMIRVFSGHSRLVGGNSLTDVCRLADDESVNEGLQETALKAVTLINAYLLEEHGDDGMFATLFFGVLDTKTGVLAYVNGGHDPLYVIAPDGDRQMLKPTGPAIGLLSDIQFSPRKITLESGAALVGYTDGVTEARSPLDEMYTRKRLEATLSRKRCNNADQLLENIQSDLFQFTEDAPQSDDITILVIRRDGEPQNKPYSRT